MAVQGSLFGESLNEHLSIYGVAIEIKEPMDVIRDGSDDDDLLILDFHIDSFAKLFLKAEEENKLVTGSYLSSSGYVSSAEYIPDTDARFVSFIVNKGWLQQHIDISEPLLKETFESGEDFFFFREIGYQLADEVHDLFNAIYGSGQINKVYLQGCAYKILSLYFKGFVLEDDLKSPINNQDIKAIEEAKSYLDSNPGKKIRMKELLEIAAMSESKFRTLFKSIVGVGPSDYHINKKIWYAKSLIESGESISNVVLQIGYSNHSYFTRTFKSYFGLTPQKYQEESSKLKKLGFVSKDE